MYSSSAGCVLTEMEGVSGVDDKGDSKILGNTSLGHRTFGTHAPNVMDDGILGVC